MYTCEFFIKKMNHDYISMTVKTLLLDIDGVLIRSKDIMRHMRSNCARYVHTKLPNCRNPAKTSDLLYLKYGHTARGLTKGFHVDTSDFNEKVFDRELISHLWEILGTRRHQLEAREIHELHRRGWNVTLFTNAPIRWATPVARSIGEFVGIKCPGDNLNEAFLKPEAGAYTEFSGNGRYVFVDDTAKNLKPVVYRPDWKPILFSNTPSPEFQTIQSIWELGSIIE